MTLSAEGRQLLSSLLIDLELYAMRSRRSSVYDEYGTGKEDAISYITEIIEEHLKECPPDCVVVE